MWWMTIASALAAGQNFGIGGTAGADSASAVLWSAVAQSANTGAPGFGSDGRRVWVVSHQGRVACEAFGEPESAITACLFEGLPPQREFVGDSDSLAGRLYQALEAYPCPNVVRENDALSVRLSDEGVQCSRSNGGDRAEYRCTLVVAGR